MVHQFVDVSFQRKTYVIIKEQSEANAPLTIQALMNALQDAGQVSVAKR
ncbi:MAG: hypothetical protein NDI90_14420 [Nitrospira sp. BO4]|jgi:hypothetical protein|nr:hypothetical protein [Nitrospira sp. BO4]